MMLQFSLMNGTLCDQRPFRMRQRRVQTDDVAGADGVEG